MPTQELLYWVLGLSIAFPLIVVLLTELRAKIRHETALQLVRITINSTVPLCALWILLEKVFEVPRTDTVSKIVQTLCWVSVLNMFLLLVNTLLTARQPSKQAPSKVLLDFVRFVLVLVGTGVVLAFVWNVNLGGVLTTLGVGSIIIGFALQDTLGSIVSGFLTMVRRPFLVGDKVEIGGMEGEVQEITWNSVVLRRPDRSLAYLPQAEVAKKTVVNVTRLTGAEHTEIFVEFSKQHPPNNVKRVLMSALWSTPGVSQEPAPLVRTQEHTDINIRYSVRFWTERSISPLETQDHFLSRLWYVAKRYDLKCELPTRKFIQSAEVNNKERLLSEYSEEISSVPLLFKMGGNMLEYVAQGATLHEYASGEYVIREGEMADSLFVVIQGDARALASDRAGKLRQVFVIKHGEFFGESSLFSGRPCSYSVVALNDLSVVLLDKAMVNRIVESDTIMVREIGRVISDRRQRISHVTMIG